jgi:hypothetical protein
MRCALRARARRHAPARPTRAPAGWRPAPAAAARRRSAGGRRAAAPPCRRAKREALWQCSARPRRAPAATPARARARRGRQPPRRRAQGAQGAQGARAAAAAGRVLEGRWMPQPAAPARAPRRAARRAAGRAWMRHEAPPTSSAASAAARRGSRSSTGRAGGARQPAFPAAAPASARDIACGAGGARGAHGRGRASGRCDSQKGAQGETCSQLLLASRKRKTTMVASASAHFPPSIKGPKAEHPSGCTRRRRQARARGRICEALRGGKPRHGQCGGSRQPRAEGVQQKRWCGISQAAAWGGCGVARARPAGAPAGRWRRGAATRPPERRAWLRRRRAGRAA